MCTLCHDEKTVAALVIIVNEDRRVTTKVERRPCCQCQQQVKEKKIEQGKT